MNSVTVVSVGDTPSELVARLLKHSGQITIVRQCPELAELLAASQSGLASIALIATNTQALTATLVDRLNAVGVSVVALAEQPGELARLQALGAISVSQTVSVEELAKVLAQTSTAGRFSESTGFSGTGASSARSLDPGEARGQRTRRNLKSDAGPQSSAGSLTTGAVGGPMASGAGDTSPLIPAPGEHESGLERQTSTSHLVDLPASAHSLPGGSERPPSELESSNANSSELPDVWRTAAQKLSAAPPLVGPEQIRSTKTRKVGLGRGHKAGRVKSATFVKGLKSLLPTKASSDHGSGFIPDGRSEVIAVWGPAGSPGRTTVAINLAAELALAGRQVLLIDADTYGASVAASLGLLDESAAFAQACRVADQGTLTSSVLAGIATEVVFAGGSFRLLSGLTRSDRWPELRAAAVERVLEAALKLVDTVVIDCGFCLENDEELSYDQMTPRRNATTVSALAMADTIYAVGQSDAIGMPRLVRGLNELAELHGGGISAPIKVVFNKTPKRSIARSAQNELTLAWERFGPDYPIAHFLPQDAETVERAITEGRLLLELGPNTVLRQAIRTMACAHVQGNDQTLVSRTTAEALNSG